MKLLKSIYYTSLKFKRYIIGMLVCTCIIALDANIRPYIIKLLIDQSSNFELKSFIFLASIYALSQILMVTAYAANDWFGTKYHSHYRESIPHIYTDRLSKYSYSFFQNNMAGSIVAKITDAFNFIFPLVARSINVFIKFIIVIIVSLILFSGVDKLFVIAAIIWIGVSIILSWVFFKLSGKYNAQYAPIRPKLYGFLSDYISNILSVWSFNNLKSEKQNLSKITGEFKEKATEYGVFLRNSYFFQGMVISVYMIFILWVLASLSMQGKITPGDFALIFMVNYKIGDMLFSMAQEMLGFSQNWGAATQAIEILDYKIEIKDKRGARNLKLTSGEIRFNKVLFHYKDVNPIFQDKTVTLDAKSNIGLVGFSGAGKSTFVNLIMRLYDVDDGSITIDGQNIKDITLSSLRQEIGVIPQDASLFHRSIMENIRYARPDASDKEVIEAAKKARADDFIIKLPQGYNTLVGERGVKLSGGQRQRMVIARAILKDAPILVLDEATSNLDSITEGKIQEALVEVMKDKTAIVVAHRLSTLLNMDRILVFEDGKIVEDGSHKELIKKNGLFKLMWDAQVGGVLPGKKEELRTVL